MANPNKAKAESGIMRWVDDRFPATQMMQDHLTKYHAPKNFNSSIFGVALVLVNQILTGVWLTMPILCRRCVCLRRVHHA